MDEDGGIRRTDGQDGDAAATRRMRELDRAEALGLVATVSLGRIVFTQHALPAVRPVNHLVEGEDIIVRIHDDGALASLVAPADVPGVVVAYEADAIDPVTHLGWSVVVTGYACPVTDADEVARFASLLRPWVGRPMTGALRIRPDLVTGFRLEAERTMQEPAGLG
ncbi:pyridoxamine 5'-phosphate oxidase family protein [Streptomyces antarcticus]|uniref:pyridoxamine 5'-phosphate oxidase family protein n=1 Tax=Streptomyces antarcticus TaxID=2996458 RepID=UPI0022701C97|nr:MULTISPECIES: pyridoxamine 5'-phosphate oxidase family protein [unclassified Streptomyces]MCY0944503.1 pyridoxamine 5'-phosphate oxidase family protein [Streptomyces sp. H34-AA3]MCZ4084532.1 pyridoxamine 5'-phosphate oxidase family protein [Streptomyces sp. H34-S5]